MFPKHLFQVVGAGGLLFLASCAQSLDTTRVAMSQHPVESKGSSGLKSQLESSVNRFRGSIGRSALPSHPGLDRLAQAHCEFMARNRGKFTLGSENISHVGFEERVLMAQRGYGMLSLAENVAGGKAGGDVAGEITQAWVQSKKHLYNLRQKWDCAGMGVYVADDGMVYVTQIFATKDLSSQTLTDRMRSF
ncbi:uncharacterized protein YkwD [Haloferula luteola]|uniref:Uncharacterized protein YkwD n=1 Tax=Haloferula luteola TaxID=595692 RepID=A0A840UXT1_9BACT|nr:CAP domain-containing protein [Haloferula luteola]MBB5350535.1 uncharacterized protein YkwD [Haloferula luteola]